MRAARLFQHDLTRMRCEWGRDARTHAIMHPVFGRNYRVRGLLAFTPGQELLWYGEAPALAEPGLVRFKAAFQEGGPAALAEIEPELVAESYFCDPWGMAMDLLGLFAAATGSAVPVNVHGQTLQGRQITDVEFEPGLHCVRAVIVRRSWYAQVALPVLGMPALAEAMKPAAAPAAAAFRWPWRLQT